MLFILRCDYHGCTHRDIDAETMYLEALVRKLSDFIKNILIFVLKLTFLGELTQVVSNNNNCLWTKPRITLCFLLFELLYSATAWTITITIIIKKKKKKKRKQDYFCIRLKLVLTHFFVTCVTLLVAIWSLNWHCTAPLDLCSILNVFCRQIQTNKQQIKLGWALFVTYTIIQSIMRSEMCSLHLTHPSVHTWSSGQPTVQRRGAVVDFLSEPGFEPTTLGYLGFQVQRSIH